MKFYALVLELHLLKIFCRTHTAIQTVRHFPEIVKSYSEQPKLCKFIKNQKSKIFMKLLLSFICVQESKNSSESSSKANSSLTFSRFECFLNYYFKNSWRTMQSNIIYFCSVLNICLRVFNIILLYLFIKWTKVFLMHTFYSNTFIF